MPTPNQHLAYAMAILESPALPDAIRAHLDAEGGAFLLGNIAGDVRYLTRQPRPATHFHDVPPASSCAPVQKMLRTYPELGDPERLSPSQAAFVSGYILHLIWDANWALDVFCPYYMDSDDWLLWKTAILHHNALRLVLDRRAFAKLPAHEVAVLLRSACPERWVPFITDAVLVEWRDRISYHLTTSQNVEGAAVVFAERMGISVDRLLNVARAIEERAEEVRVPGLNEALDRFRTHAHRDSIQALRRYWQARDVAVGRSFSALRCDF